ncbi:MAG TPA: chorismate mutase [Methanoregulaceae archaeon]|nr:chorismate mutase [Methanoregulaceae archaeon]HQJ87331.1 chorismate mutase [Methanoregulaceae archaeon]
MHSIEELRAEIDRIDTAIVDLIAERQAFAGRMARVKYTIGLPIRDAKRRQQVLEHAFERAVERGIDPRAVQRVMEVLVEMSEERQRECQGEGNLP